MNANIIAAVDFSPITSLIMKQASSLVSMTQGKLWLLHIAPPEPDFLGYQTGPQTERDFIAHQLRQQHRQLQDWAAELREQGIDAVALLLQGPTVETLCQEAEKLAADLIIVGSHGHSGLSKLLLGSVSEGILRQANCPVLVIPARGLK